MDELFVSIAEAAGGGAVTIEICDEDLCVQLCISFGPARLRTLWNFVTQRQFVSRAFVARTDVLILILIPLS